MEVCRACGHPSTVMLPARIFPSCDADHIRALFAGISSFARLFIRILRMEAAHGRGQHPRHQSRCGGRQCHDPRGARASAQIATAPPGRGGVHWPSKAVLTTSTTPSEARSTIAGAGSAGVFKRELSGRRDRLGGVKLQRNPRDSSHCSIGSFPEIVRGRIGTVCGRLIECISQSLEGFQNPIANCRIEPATV